MVGRLVAWEPILTTTPRGFFEKFENYPIKAETNATNLAEFLPPHKNEPIYSNERVDRLKWRRLSQLRVTCWPGFGESTYLYILLAAGSRDLVKMGACGDKTYTLAPLS